MKSLTLLDFSDRELLLIVYDVRDPEGWSSARDVARINLDHPEPHRPVASRLSWMRRYGAVEREFMRDEHGNPMRTPNGKLRFTQRWRLTDRGMALAQGKLSDTDRQALDRFTDDQLLVVTRWLTERQRESDLVAGALVRREWKHGTGTY
jgi:hypothetical protein